MSDEPKPPSGWDAGGDGFRRELVFGDFSEAFGFMTRVALEAERSGHHPDWTNTWNTVSIRLVSHDVGKVTARDVELAEAINRILDTSSRPTEGR